MENESKKNPFERSSLSKRSGYDNARSKTRTSIREQVVERKLNRTGIEEKAYVKFLYAEGNTWAMIYRKAFERFPELREKGERAIKYIYESNADEFKLAKEERRKEIEQEFSEDRENLLSSVLRTELRLVERIEKQIGRVIDRMEGLDPEEDYKAYSVLAKTLKDLQGQLSELSNANAARKLELNRRMLEQKKEIMGKEEEEKEEKNVTPNIIE